ncbi:MAG: DNA primase [Bacteroidales bacterium]|nr:DNA primase [Bacteroidales bacterium]
MIDHSTISRIFSAADIVEVIGEFVNLKRSGQNYKGLSPFTNEKTPSFFVSPAKGIFKCFSSGIGGNVVTFLMEHEKLSYPEALKYLARKYNIEITEKEVTEEELQQIDDRESMLALNLFAQKYYSDNLYNTEEGRAIGLSYYHEREFRDDIINKFQLGYSREQKDALTKTALNNGYKMNYLLKTGLSIQKEDYHFDRFHGRIMFPIHGLSGQILGFGARILKKDEKSAKYLNSPESDVYHKSNILYGIYFARQSIIKNDKCYLVEGYTDVISMHQAGFENVIASSGTSLTVEQIRLIKRFTKNVTVLYDGDDAGIKASMRGIDLILEEGLNVKVVLFPEGEDPDSFARNKSATGFTDFIRNNESDFITFKTRLLIKDSKSDPIKHATLITDVVHSIAVIPDGITRTVYIRQCSKMLDIDERMLYAEIRKIRRKKAEQKYHYNQVYTNYPEKESKSIQKTRPDTEFFTIERDIIRILLNYGNRKAIKVTSGTNHEELISVAQYIVNEIESDDLEFKDPVLKTIYSEINQAIFDGKEIDEKYFLFHPDDEIARISVDLLATTHQLSKIWEKHETFVETEDMRLKEIVPETVNAFKNKKVVALIKETQQQLRVSQENNDADNILLLQQRFIVLNELKKNLSKSLGDRIII